MADDIRYAELLFLRSLPKATAAMFNHMDTRQAQLVGLSQNMYLEMVVTLIEELYVRPDDHDLQMLVGKLRGETSLNIPMSIPKHNWDNPREALQNIFLGQQSRSLRLTYRGLRRIEELRDLLRRDRILEPFGVLLGIQYFRRDLEEALRLPSDVAVSVLYADMDHFKPINTKFGQSAGDVVMKAYLETVRDAIGNFGTAYRGVGDEVAVVIKGQGHDQAVDFAQKIRQGVSALECKYQQTTLPPVTASIGVATSPPEDRTVDIETLAESRKRKAKEDGRNRVVGN